MPSGTGSSGNFTAIECNEDVALAAGDRLRVQGYQDTGGSVDVTTGSRMFVRRVS